MKTKNYRTQKFRDKVSHIVNSRNHGGEIQKIKYNFDWKCETKPIKINGKSIKDCVAYYRVNVSEKDGTTQHLYFVDANDLVQLERSLKLHRVKGEDVMIKSSRKEPIPEKTILVENELYILSDFPRSYPIKIISRTKATAKYVKYDYTYSEEIMNKLKRLKDSSLKNLNNPINCKLEDLIIFDKTNGEIGTLRLYDGVWRSSKSYCSASINDDGKTYSRSFYPPFK